MEQKLLEAVMEPLEVAVVHCKAHQKGDADVIKGNQRADAVAKKAARGQVQETQMLALMPQVVLPEEPPKYTEKENQLAEKLGSKEQQDGWWVLPEEQVLMPKLILSKVLQEYHQSTHMGADAMTQGLQRIVVGPKMRKTAEQIVRRCPVCCANNPKISPKPPPGAGRQGLLAGECWQIDFSEVPRKGHYKYLLVLMDTLTGWTEAFLCRTNQAKEVVWVMLKEMIPRFGIPEGLASDQGHTLCRR
ncbi:uncharacterized protein LOC132248886 [Alligator mississippiensis]|uniref:uncharacterized protein LOC132248886 n=1 Tax=Alligator mississippiensis TaxID=8496 RepID=UPI0028775558|nr:uncharacterized protein LOC132248886 [Alligator mississippiensis]